MKRTTGDYNTPNQATNVRLLLIYSCMYVENVDAAYWIFSL